MALEATYAEIDEARARLDQTFATHKTHRLDYRVFNLKQLAYLLRDNEARICAAVQADLDKGEVEVCASELWVIYGEIELAVRRLPTWIKDEPRTADALAAYRSMKPRVRKQPKGVALNFPFLLTLGPLVGAIAAGCPAVIKVCAVVPSLKLPHSSPPSFVVITSISSRTQIIDLPADLAMGPNVALAHRSPQPSEHAPASAALLAELIPTYLDSEAYAVVQGAAETSTRLLEKQWGHVSPDYILCVKERVDDLVKTCDKVLKEFYPPPPHPRAVLTSDMASALRGERDFVRIDDALAAAGGKVVVRGEQDAASRRMGMSVVVLPDGARGEDGLFVKEEIFGPVVAVVPVNDIDEAIAYVNARPHPLALYVLSSKRDVFDRVVGQTISGSATWNDFGFSTIARNLPFGGVGDSGSGAYHGVDGFNTFSHRKAVLEVPNWMEFIQRLRYPTHMTPRVQKLFAFLLSPGVPFARPVSVEDEARRRRRRARVWVATHIVLGLVAVAAVVAVLARRR
ncbi:Hexadecenal dehydrogenase [Cryptotrichosporon argae]